MTVGVGVIGTGMIGQDHIRRITQVLTGGTVVAVNDVDAARAGQVAAALPGPSVHASAQDLIANVDAVLVASWGAAHEEQVVAAIEASKPVFCENRAPGTATPPRWSPTARKRLSGPASAPRCHCPNAFIEDGRAGVDLIRGIDKDWVSFLYCAPHTFHQGSDIEGIMRYVGPLLTHVHIADSFDHRASSGLRYIVNPPGSTARVHQHLDIGQGEVDWDVFFRSLTETGFDGIATVRVFAWEERARESSAYNLEQVASTSPNTAHNHNRTARYAPKVPARRVF